MLRSAYYFIILWLALPSCDGSEARESPDIVYPGSEVVSDTAKLFAPGLVTTDSFEHSAPAFSPDGKLVLWSRVEMPTWRSRILEMTYDDGKWSVAHTPTFSDSSANDIYPAFSPDGKTLYFSSTRKLPSGKSPAKGNVLWMVPRTAAGWSLPQPLDSVVSSGGEYAPSISNNGNLYFTYGPFRSSDWNIFFSGNNNGLRERPVAMPSNINTNHYEDGPYIAPDESYMIFESDRPGGVDNSIDLYIAFKSEQGAWSEPANMGPEINSGAAERFARVSPDGKVLFFGSNRRQINGRSNFDIYWIDGAMIARLRDRAKWRE